MEKYITQNSMKAKNLCDIFGYILENKKTDRRSIENDTGFSWGTVSANTAELIAKGYITETAGEKNPSAGRRMSSLIPNGSAVCVGLDINRTGHTAEIVGIDNSRKETLKEAFSAETQEQLSDSITTLCGKAITACVNKYHVISIGVAFQGTVDEENGISLFFPKIPDWKPLNVRNMLVEEFGFPVWLGHDPKCILLSEAYRKMYRDCILVRVDKGIGMAVMQNGIVCDDNGKFELGHILVDSGENGLLTLEGFSSIDGIAARAGVPFAEAVRNHETYGELFDDAAKRLALALCNTAVLFNPEKIIITGKLCEYKELFADRITEYFDDIYLKFGNKTELTVKNKLSAALGAALESLRYAIRSYKI